MLWRFNPDIFASFLAEPALVYTRGALLSVIVATSGMQINTVFALHPQTGSVIWKRKLDVLVVNVIAKPAASSFAGVVVVCGSDGSVLGLNITTGGTLPSRDCHWHTILTTCTGPIYHVVSLLTLRDSIFRRHMAEIRGWSCYRKPDNSDV